MQHVWQSHGGRATALGGLLIVVGLVASACAATDSVSPAVEKASSTTVTRTGAASLTTTTAMQVSGEADTRTLWGFVPFPAAADGRSIGEVFQFVAAEGNMVAFHFDDGIPWEGLLSDSDLPVGLVEEIASLRAFSLGSPQLGVYVATAITNEKRDAIAGSWRAGDPPPTIQGRTFADPMVREGIRRWIRYLVDELNPDWLNVAVEINMYERANPEDYPNLVSLYRELYEEVKLASPDTVVFASFQMELADPLAAGDLVDAMDMVGISTYPYINGAGFPSEDYFASVADLGLPIAVAETGYPAKSLPTLSGERTYVASDQAAYVEWLGRRAESLDLVFVTWFFPSDITGWIEPLPDAEKPVARLFEFLGMRDSDGTSRPALDVWRALLKR